MTESFIVTTTLKEEFINITARVQAIVHRHQWTNGLLHLFIPHTTAAITINENADPSVTRDILYGLANVLPHHGYHHAEGNSEAHIKSSMIGVACTVVVQGQSLVLGTWQGIYFCEFDGPRDRKVLLTFIPYK